MKKNKKPPTPSQPKLNENDIRVCAYRLYEQSGCLPGRDLDNWLEAKALLEADLLKQKTPTHPRQAKPPQQNHVATIIAIEPRSAPVLTHSQRS